MFIYFGDLEKAIEFGTRRLDVYDKLTMTRDPKVGLWRVELDNINKERMLESERKADKEP